MNILSISAYEQKVADLEKDRADFEAELDRAEKRIKELEEGIARAKKKLSYYPVMEGDMEIIEAMDILADLL